MRDRFTQLRVSPLVLGFVFAAAMAAAVLTSLGPRSAGAQEATQAAGSAAPTTAASTATEPAQAESTAPKSEEEQEKAFLLEGPIVKWTAHTFHMTVEAASDIFQLVNFVILALLIGVPIVRILPKIFHKRSKTLGASLQTAREATADAHARLSAVEAKLAGLDDEIKAFREQVEKDSLEDEARIKAALQEESARIVQAAEQELSVAAAQARRGLRNFAADLAIEQAVKQLELTTETDKALIAEFIGGVASGNGTGPGNGGKN